MGILAAIAIPRFATVTQTAENRSTQAAHRILISAVSMYQAANNGALPAATAIDTNAEIDAVLGEYFEGSIDDFEPTGSTHVFSAPTTGSLQLVSKARAASAAEATGMYTQIWD